MKQKFFLSLNSKIMLIMMLVFACISTLFLSVFMMSYIDQINQEVELSRKKAERIWEIFEENIWLRENLKEEYLENIEDIVSASSAELSKLNDHWSDKDTRILKMRGDLLSDIQGARSRSKKIRDFGYFIVLAFLLIIVSLIVLWMVMRRLILSPIEELLRTTNQISAGNLTARISLPEKRSKQDELDLLARDFNQMAENIETSVDKIEKNRKFLQNLIDTIPDGIRIVDEDFNIVLVNKAYEDLHASAKPLLNKKCYAVTLGIDAPCTSEDNPCPWMLLKQNSHPVKVIQRYTDNEGKERYAEASCALLSFPSDDEKGVRRIVEVFRSLERDIVFSHRQKLASVGMLASSVAHEMRNPLGAIRLVLENVMDKTDTKPLSPEELKHYLSLIYDQMTYCIDVTSRLLKMSRNAEDVLAPVDWNEVVSETSSLLEYEAKKRGIEVVIQADHDHPVSIVAADAELRMAAVNVVQNAFHAMKNGGTLTIRTSGEGNKVAVSFSDTGCGISPENLRRIFEPFFSQNLNDGGTGLGLVITKNIIEKFGGKILVESAPGKGTTFRFVFSEQK